jgi:poly-beta-hydroxyalkanoate depolymerase
MSEIMHIEIQCNTCGIHIVSHNIFFCTLNENKDRYAELHVRFYSNEFS